ncbi:MAG: hypothetical protein WAN12_09420 [Candidatus Acidiferrum sp.]
MSTVDDLAMQILADVVADFRAKNLGSQALNDGYVGVSVVALEMKYCADASHSKVDFDLALKQLEESKFVGTGPMVPYENTPGSQFYVIAIFSKREFVYLTEKGYKAAQKTATKPRSPVPNVHISGGSFYQSPIGIGSTVDQAVNFNISNDSEVIEYLAKLLTLHDSSSGEEGKRDVVELVNTAKTGDLGKAKPIFQRLFGAAKETTKQVAWGVITAYVSKQLGL